MALLLFFLYIYQFLLTAIASRCSFQVPCAMVYCKESWIGHTKEMSDFLGHTRLAYGYKFGYIRPRKLSVMFVEMSGNVSIFQGQLKGLWIGEVRRSERKCGFCGWRNGVRSPECCDMFTCGGTGWCKPMIEKLSIWVLYLTNPASDILMFTFFWTKKKIDQNSTLKSKLSRKLNWFSFKYY